MLITCKDCQKEASSEAKACPFCGAPIKSKSYTVAVLLTFVFGAVGLNFYRGRPLRATAIALVVLTIAAVPLLGIFLVGLYQLIFFIAFLVGGEEKFQKNFADKALFHSKDKRLLIAVVGVLVVMVTAFIGYGVYIHSLTNSQSIELPETDHGVVSAP
jgi:hypothetical protein